MLALGFSSALPLILLLATQPLRLRRADVPLHDVGLIGYVTLAYTLKFLWAPIVASTSPPGLGRLLGRRRAWMLLAQIVVAIGLAGLAFADPRLSLTRVVVFALITAFASATQDIVVDAWRIDAAPSDRQGIVTATYLLGARFAALCASALTLHIAQVTDWTRAYLVLVALMTIGISACLLAPRQTGPEATAQFDVQESFVRPLEDLWQRFGPKLLTIVAFVALYRMPDIVTGTMAGPLYVDRGFSNDEIALISKTIGVWITILGAFAGGLAITRFKLMPTLLIGGIAASASHLCLALLAVGGHKIWLLALSVSVENLAGGIAGTALIAYMSTLPSPTMVAAQYALFSSLYALPGKLVGGLSGYVVEPYGYATFFVGSSLIGIPVFFLGLLIWRDQRREEMVNDATLEALDPAIKS